MLKAAAHAQSSKSVWLCATAIFLALYASPALAQDNAGNPEPVAAESQGSSSDIVVTARRKEERLLDVPVAATVLGGETLDRYRPSTLVDVQTQVPSLYVAKIGSGSGGSISLRGVASVSFDAGVEQMVSTVVDSVGTSRGRVLDAGLFDIQSIEVLKGPQALFFGKNSPGGVISITTASPGQQFEGYVRAGYTFENRRPMIEGAVSVPLSDTLSVRVAGRASKAFRGFYENTAVPTADLGNPTLTVPVHHDRLGAPSIASARITAAWRPTPEFDLTAKLLFDHYRDKSESNAKLVRCPTGFAVHPVGGPDPSTICGLELTQSESGLPAAYAARFGRSNGGVSFAQTNTVLASVVANYNWDNLTLTSVTGYLWYAHTQFGDSDQTSFNIVTFSQPDRNRSFNQELRLASSFDGPLNFTIGGLYQRDRRRFDSRVVFVPLPPALAFDPVSGRYDQYDATAFNRARTLSAFAQGSWQITPNLELAGGARYTNERKAVDQGVVYANAIVAAAFAPAGVRIVAERTFENVSPEATLTWKPTRQQTLYAAYKTGYLSGGFSNPGVLPATASADSVAFRPAKAQGGEIGYKVALDGLNLDLTLYRYHYRDIQLTALDNTNSSAPTFRTLNAARARSQGVELQGNYDLGDLLLRGSVLYSDAKYLDYTNGQCYAGQTAAQGCVNNLTQDVSGQRIDLVSKWTLSGGFTYDLPVANTWRVALSSDVRYGSSYNPTTAFAQFDPAIRQSDYANIDASLRLHSEESGLELSLIGRNLTNHLRMVFAVDTLTPGTKLGTLSEPRTIEFQLGYRF